MKAELLRKQEEVNKFKKPSVSDPFSVRVSKHPSKSSKDRKKTHETPKPISSEKSEKAANQNEEDHEMLAKSKRVLEAKAKLYDKMTNSGGSLNSDDTCLVQFNRKQQDERQPFVASESDSDSDDGHYNNDSDPDSDGKWTEYTDCLGRTRKCLKEDVAFFKKKDRELAASTTNRMTNSPPPEEKKTPWIIDTNGVSSIDLPIYKSTNDDDTMSMMSDSSKMGQMRIEWENKEQDNLNRDKIHYQDVLFDEARTHGVGYYGFSTDLDERQKQQRILEEEREKTLNEQKKREEVRLMREKMIADRVFAAKNRQRARLGLPPLSREELQANESNDSGSEQKLDDDQKQKKKAEKKLKKKEKLEKEREEKRQQHVRPWDHGKDGIDNKPSQPATFDDEDEWEYKADKPEPMSQAQWNELQRAERNPDFAPPIMESFNRFTTKKPATMKRRNETAVNNMFNEPIRNELDASDFPIDDNDTNKRRRAEVAPPPTFDYYGPTSVPRPRARNPNADIGDSIEAGLRFLREKSDKSGPGTKQAWVANTVYEE